MTETFGLDVCDIDIKSTILQKHVKLVNDFCRPFSLATITKVEFSSQHLIQNETQLQLPYRDSMYRTPHYLKPLLECTKSLLWCRLCPVLDTEGWKRKRR
jgi:hypothetical protein